MSVSRGHFSRSNPTHHYKKGNQGPKGHCKADRKAAKLAQKINQQQAESAARKKPFQAAPLQPSDVEELQLQVTVLLPLLGRLAN